VQPESLTEQELIEPDRIAASLQPGHVQQEHAMEQQRRLQVSQRKHRERRHNGHSTYKTPTLIVLSCRTARWVFARDRSAQRLPEHPDREAR
jgi:hypothetical protein